MKMTSLRPLILSSIACLFPLAALPSAPVILPVDDPEAAESHRVIWATDPGIRYELQESDDLENWETVAGFPTEAEALAQQHDFEASPTGRFFRVRSLDEQPPEIVTRSPEADAFAVGRFARIRVTLADVSPIDEASISFTVGEHGTFVLEDSELIFEDDRLVFDFGGDTALGAFGETVTVALDVADVLGNATTHTWSFDLELEPQVADNVFVFGSPDAQRAGQQLSGPAASLAARFGGPLRMNATDVDWAIDFVEEDRVVLAYEGPQAPEFFVGQLLTNLAPANVSEIFYRQIDTIEDDPDAGRLILLTTEVLLGDVLEEGSANLDEGAVFLEMDEDGNLVRAITLDAVFSLPTIGADFSGSKLLEQEGFTVTLDEAYFLFYPSLHASLETRWGRLRRFEASARGEVRVACVPRLTLDRNDSASHSREFWEWSHWIWTSVGIIPVGVELKATITGKLDWNAAISGEAVTGFRQRVDMGVGGRWVRDASPAVTWDRWFDVKPIEMIPFDYTVSGSLDAKVFLIPQIDVRVYGAAGLYVNLDPRLEMDGSATVTNGELVAADWFFGAYADLNAGLSVRGFDTGSLPSLPPLRLFTREWTATYETKGEPGPIVIRTQPKSQTVRIGDSAVLSVDAVGTGPLKYQWFQNGQLLPGQTASELRLNRVTQGHGGKYVVRVAMDSDVVDSEVATVTVTPASGATPEGMVLIPGGTLAMSMGTRTVDTFYIGRHEVTWGEWKAVRGEAAARGYDIGSVGAGCADDHPVHSVNWFDALKWSNAKSEMEGLTPVYTVSGSVFKTGQPSQTSISQNLSANGYRLPLEAEWEFAARGGNQTNGYTYSGSNDLNAVGWYWDNSGGAACDLWDGRGTWPVGQKASNELGLYDMSGNVWEWCWDQSGSFRLFRGGSWYDNAFYCTVTSRLYNAPGSRSLNVGFRLARSSGS